MNKEVSVGCSYEEVLEDMVTLARVDLVTEIGKYLEVGSSGMVSGAAVGVRYGWSPTSPPIRGCSRCQANPPG